LAKLRNKSGVFVGKRDCFEAIDTGFGLITGKKRNEYFDYAQ